MTIPEKVYVRLGLAGPYLGPADVDQIRANVADGEIPWDAKWVEATGQTAGELKRTSTWHMMSDLLGPMPTSAAEPATNQPAQHPLDEAETGPSLLSLLGWLWLLLGGGAGLYLLTLGEPGDPSNPLLIALGVVSIGQALVGCLVCTQLATISDRVREIRRKMDP